MKIKSDILNAVVYILLIPIFLFIAYISAIYPMCGDDFRFSFSCVTHERIASFSEALQSQLHHYIYGLGRFVVHLLTQWFLSFDRIWFVIANTLCYILSTLLISKVTARRFHACHWLIVALTLWIILPHTGCTVFTVTGSFNYLWCVLFNSIFLYFLFSDKKSFNIAAIFVAFVAGHAHEAVALGIWVSIVAYYLLSGKKSSLFIAAIVIYILGFASNALAPSTLVRIEKSTSSEQLTFLQLLLRYASNSFKTLMQLIKSNDIGIVISSLLTLITLGGCIFIKVRKIKSKWLLPTGCFLLGAFISLMLNIYTGVLYSRAFFGFCVMAYIAFLMMAFNNEGRYSKHICSIILLCSLCLSVKEVHETIGAVDLFNKRYAYIETEAKKGAHIIPEHELWNSKLISSKYVESYGISSNILANVDEARMWGVEAFSVFPRSMYEFLRTYEYVFNMMVAGETINVGGLTFVCTGEQPLSACRSYYIDYSQTAMSKYIPSKLREIYLKNAAKRLVTEDTPIFRLKDKYYTYCHRSGNASKLIITYPGKTLEIALPSS